MLPAGMFLVWSCHNACQNMVYSQWNSFLTILVEHTEAYITYIALQSGGPFSSSMRLSGVRTISSAKSTNFSLKRACVRKLGTLNINYTQLTVKVKFFFKKNDCFRKQGV